MQKNTEHIPNRDDVGTAILQHLDGLRGIDTHCHHLPDDQFQNMGVKFLYDHSYCNWMDDLLGLLHSYSNVYADLCWLLLISTSAAKRFLREALEIGGSNRILWGCDTWTVEESYGSLLAFRFSLCRVLTEKIEDGYLSVSNAKDIIDKILFDNAGKLYL